MTQEIIIVFILLALAVAAFSIEIIAAEVVALGLMLLFVVFGILSPEQAFAGFANETVLLILGLLIMTVVLSRTALLQAVSRLLLRATGDSSQRFLWLIMITVGLISSMMSNTAATAFFLPVVIAVSRRLKTSESRFLLPLAFASILSSSVTLIATSTNLVVSGLMKNKGLPPLSMFELTPVGIVILVIGVLYLGLIGWRLIPKPAEQDNSPGSEQKDAMYTAELIILEDSPFAGKSIEESNMGRDMDVQILHIIRRKSEHLRATPDLVLQVDDVLLIEADYEALLGIKSHSGLELKAEATLLSTDNQKGKPNLTEAIIPPGSSLIGKSLKQTRFRDRHGVIVLGIQKSGKRVRKMSQALLQGGDILLLQGPTSELAVLEDMKAIRVVGESLATPLPPRISGLIAAIFALSLLAGIFKLIPLSVSVLAGAFLMLASNVVSPATIYREVEWKVIILIACMLSVGTALQKSGTDQLIASWLAGTASSVSPIWLLVGVFVLTVGLSQPMSNQAAAALVLPIAVAAAMELGINPRAMAITVAVAASCSFLTPLEPSCLMVYGPGGYRFRDFLIVGLPLTVVILIITILMVPWLWPLR
jgi:di/tricarboxylate transporter